MTDKHILFLLKWMLKALSFIRVKDKPLMQDIENYIKDLVDKSNEV